jgi:hypothetical protein
MELKWLMGVGAAAALGTLIYYLSDDGRRATETLSSITREKLLAVLQDLKKETMVAFTTVASFALNIKQSNPHVPESELKSILLEYSPLKEIIGKAEAKVYDKHEVTQVQVQTAYEGEYVSDDEVKRLVVEMKENLERAFIGIQPTFTATLPSKFTPDFTLRLVATMFESNKIIVRKMIENLQKEGVRLNKNDPRFIKATQDMEEAFDQAKDYIFDRNGLNEMDEPAALLFHTAITKYSQEEPDFARRYQEIEMDYKMTMQMLFSQQ